MVCSIVPFLLNRFRRKENHHPDAHEHQAEEDLNGRHLARDTTRQCSSKAQGLKGLTFEAEWLRSVCQHKLTSGHNKMSKLVRTSIEN